MSKFNTREEVNTSPCMMADEYKFFKINIQEFRDWLNNIADDFIFVKEKKSC